MTLFFFFFLLSPPIAHNCTCGNKTKCLHLFSAIDLSDLFFWNQNKIVEKKKKMCGYEIENVQQLWQAVLFKKQEKKSVFQTARILFDTIKHKPQLTSLCCVPDMCFPFSWALVFFLSGTLVVNKKKMSIPKNIDKARSSLSRVLIYAYVNIFLSPPTKKTKNAHDNWLMTLNYNWVLKP